MEICIAGKNNIAVNILQFLVANYKEHFDFCVVCNKTDCGKNGFQRSLKLFAAQNGITEKRLEDLYEIEDLVFLSLEFDRIVKPHLFRTRRLFNVHFSLLPKYKGMYTSALVILNGEKKSGVTLHRIDRGIDTGEIIAQKEFAISNDDTCRDLYLKHVKNGVDLVIENIDDILKGNEKSVPQNAQFSSYYSKNFIDYKNLRIDLNQTAWNIQRQIKAFSFREYQMPEVFGKNIIAAKITSHRSNCKAGTIVFEMPHLLMISTVDYNIVLYEDRFSELLEACEKGDVQTIREICFVSEHINSADENGRTPLMAAVCNNQIKAAKFLIGAGADIFVADNNEKTLLMHAKEAFLKTKDDTLFALLSGLTQ